MLGNTTEPALSWSRQDLEQRLGFRGGRYTSVNGRVTFFMAIAMTVLFFGIVMQFRGTSIGAMFLDRGWVQYATVFLTSWSLAILFVKWTKLRFQQRSLHLQVVPSVADFVLSATTVEQVTEQIHQQVDDPRYFVLFNRITIALSNLRNLGQVADVDEILRSQADNDESFVETSYSLVQGFVWAIPILGFIGTVLGLAEAIGGFSDVLSQDSEMSAITAELKNVTAGLSTAFETTLVALVAALVVQLIITALKKSEEEFLDKCSEYCLRNVVGRLRIMPYESAMEIH